MRINVVHGLWEVSGLIFLINLDNYRDQHTEWGFVGKTAALTYCKYSMTNFICQRGFDKDLAVLR